MYAPERSNPIGRNGQLRGSLRSSGPTLQRQQSDDDLQTIDEPMVELLGQHVLALQEIGFVTKQSRFAGASCLQFGDQRGGLCLLICIAFASAAPGELK